MTATFRDIRRHAELLRSDSPLVVRLAGLHAPDVKSGRQPVCTGCWRQGDRRDAESWPCRTWTLLDEEVDQ